MLQDMESVGPWTIEEREDRVDLTYHAAEYKVSVPKLRGDDAYALDVRIRRAVEDFYEERKW